MLAGAAGGVTLHRLRADAPSLTPALPELHGQAVWAPGERAAPAFALPDQRGGLVSLGALRGRPVLLAFLGVRCHGCAPEALRLASILRRLPAADRPNLVVVSLDGHADTRAEIVRAARRWGLVGAWRWHWLTAASSRMTPVWRAFGVSEGSPHRLRIALIDRRGDERTAYLFPFMPAFVEGDLIRLAGERA